MAVGDAYVFPGFLTPVLTQLFFPKPPTTFLTCFCRGERRKYAGKKSRLNRGSNSQPPGLESDTLTTEPPGRGSNNETLAQSKLKAFANDIINVSEKNEIRFWEGRKHFGKKEKMLVTSIFSISQNVFRNRLPRGRQKCGLCGKELTLFKTSPGFYVFAVQVF